MTSRQEKDEYRKIVQAISPSVGDAGVSIEVFADLDTSAEEMLAQEVAAVLAQKGIEVAMVLNDDRVFKRLFSREMSSFFETYYAARGVRLIKSMSVIEFRGDEAVNSAVLRDRQTVQCELVVAGIGVQPAIEVVTNSGLDLGDGISVNEYLQRCFRSGRCGELPGCAFRKTQARRALGLAEIYRHAMME